MNYMPLLLQLYAYLFGYEYAKRKFNKKSDLEKENGAKGNKGVKRVKGVKGVKGLRDFLREIDEKISKNKSID